MSRTEGLKLWFVGVTFPFLCTGPCARVAESFIFVCTGDFVRDGMAQRCVFEVLRKQRYERNDGIKKKEQKEKGKREGMC